MNFAPFAAAVAAQFALMSKHELFVVGSTTKNANDEDVDNTTETMLAGYQDAFPAGTNPIFRELAALDE